jgi:hypothetical protein
VTERGPFDKVFEDAGRFVGGKLVELLAQTQPKPPPTSPAAEPAEAKSTRSVARREDAEEFESLQFQLRAAQLGNREKDAALQIARERIAEHRSTIASLRDELRHLKENAVIQQNTPSVTDDGDDDPYPRFWRRAVVGSTTDFYRVDDPKTVFFKFRQSDEWRPAPTLRECDMPGGSETPRVRDWDNPDDPQNQAPTPTRIARRRAFQRAKEESLARHPAGRPEVGHGTGDGSHDGPLYAQLPGNWPQLVRQLVYDVDLNAADWRERLYDGLVLTLDAWASDARTRAAHDAIQRVTGVSDS